MAIETPPPALGTPCPDFRLPGVDGKTHARDDFAASPVLVVMFICNHCPYVQAVEERLIEEDGSESVQTTMTMRTVEEAMRRCDACYLAPHCPAFQAHASCAFKIPVVIKTKDQLQALMRTVIEVQGKRVMFAQFAEEVEGQGIDPALSGEIDRLFKIMGRYKKQGQFRAFWSAFTDSVNFMASKEVVIESMWSPAVALLKAQGVNVLYAAPPEGFRGWCSAEGISSSVKDPAKLQACYDYINWNYNGFLGAEIMRQGYYIANGTKLLPWINSAQGKQYGFTAAEYDYWWGGKAAPRDLPGITGKPGDIKKGAAREGGAFDKRICKYMSWNSYPRESVYLVKTVNDFLAA